MKSRNPGRFRWRTWHFAVIFVLNIALVSMVDCLIDFPISGSIHTDEPKLLEQRLEDRPILQDQVVWNLRIISYQDENGNPHLLALEQYGPVARCRILEDDGPPALPWRYYIYGKAFSVMLNLTETGTFEVLDVSEHNRIVTARYFLLAGVLEAVYVLVYKLIKKTVKHRAGKNRT